MLLGILYLYFHHNTVAGFYTFSLDALYKSAPQIGQPYAFWLFLAFFIGFAIKVPMFPFHTWLPDAHVEAPTAGSVILGAVAGVIVILATDLLEYLRIDDPCGAWPVHGACGIWGTLSLGFFACGQYGATGPTGPDNSAPLTGLF